MAEGVGVAVGGAGVAAVRASRAAASARSYRGRRGRLGIGRPARGGAVGVGLGARGVDVRPGTTADPGRGRASSGRCGRGPRTTPSGRYAPRGRRPCSIIAMSPGPSTVSPIRADPPSPTVTTAPSGRRSPSGSSRMRAVAKRDLDVDRVGERRLGAGPGGCRRRAARRPRARRSSPRPARAGAARPRPAAGDRAPERGVAVPATASRRASSRSANAGSGGGAGRRPASSRWGGDRRSRSALRGERAPQRARGPVDDDRHRRLRRAHRRGRLVGAEAREIAQGQRLLVAGAQRSIAASTSATASRASIASAGSGASCRKQSARGGRRAGRRRHAGPPVVVDELVRRRFGTATARSRPAAT